MSTFEDRLNNLHRRIQSLTEKVSKLEASATKNEHESNAKQVIQADLMKRNVFTAKFYTVPENYYDLTLDQRASLLGGNQNQLCKSIIFENTACEHTSCDDPTDSKYYMVIIQYVAKINTTMLQKFVHGMRPPEQRLSKKKINFQLASEEDSLRLSGFGHNAIAPFGMTQKNIPVIICERCLEVKPPLLYLGGGEVHVKLLIPITDLVRSLQAYAALITDPR